MQTLNIILYSTIAGISTLLGSYLVIKYETWTKKNMIFLISLATGILLATAFLDILPESLELNENALVFALISILLLYVLEQRIIIHSCHNEECNQKDAKGTISIMGLSLHSLIDGLIIGAGFSFSNSLGMITSFGVIMHEIPEGISIYSILSYNGFKQKTALAYSSLVAVATPFGAVASTILFKNISSEALGVWLAFAAGSIIYIGASDLIPETHEKANQLNVLFVLLGAGIIFYATKII
ncbi:hypothetical protein COY62_01230 [bacterium (Candidatus Howlettbacteria) CG_4_10_14_0_8_um_filter_40_9]|nr:MAG: hypothetical protein COY62_01230 [bacterium (Candidatus Howlettbacteria) CG_4_10_14_0_8_um_filter_40_9]